MEDVGTAANLVISERKRLTLEGFPFCVLPELVSHQLNYDRRQITMLMRGEVISDYDMFMSHRMRVLGELCHNCVWKDDCGGVYPEYIQIHGWSEFAAQTLASSNDPPTLAAK